MNDSSAPTFRNRNARRLPIIFAIALGALTPSFAAFHFMVVQEVFVGTPGDMINPNLGPDQRAQYVMLRMTSSGQNFVSGTAIRVEDATGNILGSFGSFTANVPSGGAACAYPSCPAIVIGTMAAKNLFTFTFDKIVDGQPGRVALPVAGGRVCFHGGTSVFDCVAWGTFSCSAANCPGGPNALHAGDLNGNGCDTNYDLPVAGGLQFGKSLTRSTFNCGAKSNSTQFSPVFPKPVNNAGANNNADTDTDGLIDQLDCSDSDTAIQWPPIEVQNLRVSGQPVSTDSWDSQAGFVGTGVMYDEIRGSLSQLVNFTDDSCNNPETTLTSSVDASVPPEGDGYYYLVRAEGGGCTGTTYGTQSNGTPRDPQLTSCP